MRLNFRHFLIFLLIVLASVGFGIGFDAVATAIEKHTYPIDESLSADVSANAAEFGIPEAVLWGFVHTQSRFSSTKVSADGSIGLTQLTPEEFSMILEDVLKEEAQSADMLYAPKTNLRCGAAYLSYLYHRYGKWETAFAAYEIGTDTVDAWLLDPTLTDEHGTLARIPDESLAEHAKKAVSACEYYQRLYYES